MDVSSGMTSEDRVLFTDGEIVDEAELDRRLRETVSVEAAAEAYGWYQNAPVKMDRADVMGAIGNTLALRYGMGCPQA